MWETVPGVGLQMKWTWELDASEETKTLKIEGMNMDRES